MKLLRVSVCVVLIVAAVAVSAKSDAVILLRAYIDIVLDQRSFTSESERR